MSKYCYENKLRRLAEENKNANWLIMNGKCIQIKRKQFENLGYIDNLRSPKGPVYIKIVLSRIAALSIKERSNAMSERRTIKVEVKTETNEKDLRSTNI